MKLLLLTFSAVALGFAQTGESLQAFDNYVKSVEAQAHQKSPEKGPHAFTGLGGRPVAGDGLLHDWVATEFYAGVKPAEVLARLKDFANYKNFYPEVVDAKLLSGSGDLLRSYVRVKKKKVLTIYLDTEYEVRIKAVGDGFHFVSRSQKIQEDGSNWGVLYRINAYWTLLPMNGGTQVTCRAISLSRDVPMGLGWAVKPIIRDLPRESLQATLAASNPSKQGNGSGH
jgi:Polyketide cyclase / dehydrase and lipid transport